MGKYTYINTVMGDQRQLMTTCCLLVVAASCFLRARKVKFSTHRAPIYICLKGEVYI